MMGLGYTLTEDFVVNKDTGVPLNDSFDSYKIPSTGDLPELEVILIEQPVASGPFGAKGLGEIGVIAVAPAIANAVYDAVGVRVTELPVKPEMILDALATK